MSNLVAAVFKDETMAFDVRAALKKAERLTKSEDSVVGTRNAKDKIKLDGAIKLADEPLLSELLVPRAEGATPAA